MRSPDGSQSGYALAMRSIASTAIQTDSEGLDSGWVRISSGGFEVPAYYARPMKASSSPILLVVQEIFGVHEHIRDICRRLAKEGYYAVAPELYVRLGDVSVISDVQDIIRKVVRKVPDEQALADLDAAFDFAINSGEGDPNRLGIVGFCWGGRITWLYSAHQPKVKAGAAWYGKLAAGPYSTPSMQPKQPLDVAQELHGAVLGLYGGRDEGIPLIDVAKMRAAIAAAGKESDCQILVYPEAGHAFNADYRPSYHETSAKDAWAKMLHWFKKHGLADSTEVGLK